jgi:hypothetical protein
MRTHRGPHGHEQRKRGEALEIGCEVLVAVEHDVGEIVRAAINQVHQQKRQIVEDVDAGERIAELNAIERRWATVEETHIPQMEVTMAAPDFSCIAPSIKELSDRRNPVEGCRIKLPDLMHIERRA